MITEVSFDMNGKGEYCDGTLTFDGRFITAAADGKELFRHEAGELIMRTYVGCGELEIMPGGEDSDPAESITVCRYSMTRVEEIGEFCKVINYFIRTGEHTEINKSGFRICPKCGRHFARGMSTCLFCAKKTYLFKVDKVL